MNKVCSCRENWRNQSPMNLWQCRRYVPPDTWVTMAHSVLTFDSKTCQEDFSSGPDFIITYLEHFPSIRKKLSVLPKTNGIHSASRNISTPDCDEDTGDTSRVELSCGVLNVSGLHIVVKRAEKVLEPPFLCHRQWSIVCSYLCSLSNLDL